MPACQSACRRTPPGWPRCAHHVRRWRAACAAHRPPAKFAARHQGAALATRRLSSRQTPHLHGGRHAARLRPAGAARRGARLLCAGARCRRRHGSPFHERRRDHPRRPRGGHAALPVPVHGAACAPPGPAAGVPCHGARRGRAGRAARPGAAAVCGRPLLRRAHELAGSGARAPRRGARPGVSRLPAAPGRQAGRGSRAASRAGAAADAVPAGHARCAGRAHAAQRTRRAARRTCDLELRGGWRPRLPRARAQRPHGCRGAPRTAEHRRGVDRGALVSRRALERYAAKRTFTRTPEPPPQAAAGRRGPLLFVVQKHAARRLHYDFRLELDGVLRSWAVPKGPSLDPGDKRMAVEVEDHPFDYGSFEGVIPAKQYGAGKVIVWDCGAYSPDEDHPVPFADRAAAQKRVREELAAGKLSFFLCGEKLKGSFALVRTKQKNQWLLIKHKDRFAQPNDVLGRPHSVLSGVSLDELEPAQMPARLDAARLAPSGPAEALPKQLKPMLAETGDAPQSNPQWRYEPKLDGYRVIAFVTEQGVRLQSRRGLDLTPVFPEVAAELAGQPGGQMILDGEIVALGGDGRPSFNALQNRAQLKGAAQIAAAQREAPVAMVCFDLLHFAGLNLRGAPYAERRRYLSQCLMPAPHLQLMHASDNAEKLYTTALELGFEGIVAKRLDSLYLPGQS